MKAYWDSLTKEQQGELAGKVGSTPATYGWFSMVIKSQFCAGEKT